MADRRHRVLYWIPEHSEPSWGVGLLHGHVGILRDLGWDAWAVVESPERADPSDSGDLAHTIPLDDCTFGQADLLVVPEVRVSQAADLAPPCRLVLFVQGLLPLLRSAPSPAVLERVDWAGAFTILPHLRRTLARLYGLDAALVPPYVHPRFFAEAPKPPEARRREILVHTKTGLDELPLPGRAELESMFEHHAPPDWRIRTLRGMSHESVAEAFREAPFLVNLNLMEAFNSTVPEAMASGCIPLCYEAVGGRDFLSSARGEENAIVSGTCDLASLVDRLLELLRTFDERATRHFLREVQSRGLATADGFRARRTEEELVAFLTGLEP